MTDNNQLGGVKQNLDYNASYTLKDPDHDEIKDGYQLRWVGKDYAKLQENLRPETVIVPDSLHNAKEHNKDSQNLFLTGDNLEVLKHLEHAYTGQVDMIYIDPPYNTGSDGFVYSDNFRFTDQQLRDTLGLTEIEVERIKNIYGKASHSAWLTFMYPRLKLAKKLLKDTGVIFVSIDDNEQAQLKLLMDEIFNEGNSVGNIAWESKTKSQNTETSYNRLQPKVEHIFVYTKKTGNRFNLVTKGEKEYPLTDEKGAYREYTLEVMNATGVRGRKSMIYEIEGISPPVGKQWKLGQDQVAMHHSSGNLFIRDGKVIIKMRPGSEKSDLTEPFWGLFSKDIGTAESAKKELNELFGVDNIFDTVKPLDLIERLIFHTAKKDGLVLDFFAGSGTLAHAVMRHNRHEGVDSLRYIVCTLDEAVNPKSEAAKAGYKTIDEIARKRIDLAAEKLGDTSGYRHYRFVKPDIKTLEQIEDFDPNTPKLVADDMITPFSEKSLTGGTDERGVSTILTTWLVDDGYSFDTTAQELDLAGYTAHYAPEIARLYLIEKDGWSKDACKALLNALGKNEIAVNAIVVYSYSFDFTSLTELKNNIKSNLDGKPQVIERY